MPPNELPFVPGISSLLHFDLDLNPSQTLPMVYPGTFSAFGLHIVTLLLARLPNIQLPGHNQTTAGVRAATASICMHKVARQIGSQRETKSG